MPRFVDGYPVDRGASDTLDSSRLAGVMAMIARPDSVSCADYQANKELYPAPYFRGVRHPTQSNDPRMFSRDQAVCLAAGLFAQGNRLALCDLYLAAKRSGNRAQNFLEWDGTKKRWGADYMPPHVMGALAVAAGIQDRLTVWQASWLYAEMFFNGIFNPLNEPNQIFSICFMSGKQWIKRYKKINRQWKNSIVDYWCGWRDEKELAADFITWAEGQ